jgi:hypothetical protein
VSVSESQRRQVYADLERAIGPESAAILMERAFAVDWRDLATHASVDALRASTDAQFVAVRGEIAELRGEMRGSIAELRGEIRSQLPKLIAANIASGLGLVSLTLSAAKLL